MTMNETTVGDVTLNVDEPGNQAGDPSSNGNPKVDLDFQPIGHIDWREEAYWADFYDYYVPARCSACGGGRLTLAASVISSNYGDPWTVHSFCDDCDTQHVEEVDY